MFVLSARSLRTCTKSKATSCQTEEMAKLLHQLQNLKEKLKVHDLMPKIFSENKTSLRNPLFYRCSSTTKLFEEVIVSLGEYFVGREANGKVTSRRPFWPLKWRLASLFCPSYTVSPSHSNKERAL